jgi:hypothetical protein
VYSVKQVEGSAILLWCACCGSLLLLLLILLSLILTHTHIIVESTTHAKLLLSWLLLGLELITGLRISSKWIVRCLELVLLEPTSKLVLRWLLVESSLEIWVDLSLREVLLLHRLSKLIYKWIVASWHGRRILLLLHLWSCQRIWIWLEALLLDLFLLLFRRILRLQSVVTVEGVTAAAKDVVAGWCISTSLSDRSSSKQVDVLFWLGWLASLLDGSVEVKTKEVVHVSSTIALASCGILLLLLFSPEVEVELLVAHGSTVVLVLDILAEVEVEIVSSYSDFSASCFPGLLMG